MFSPYLYSSADFQLSVSTSLCLGWFPSLSLSLSLSLSPQKAVLPACRAGLKYQEIYTHPGEGNGTPLQYSCLENPTDRGAWWAAVHGVTKSRTRLSDFTFSFHFHTLEKEMATHSSVLAWRIPGMGDPGGLLSTGSHRVGHDWSNLAAAAAYTPQKKLPLNNNWWDLGYKYPSALAACWDNYEAGALHWFP